MPTWKGESKYTFVAFIIRREICMFIWNGECSGEMVEMQLYNCHSVILWPSLYSCQLSQLHNFLPLFYYFSPLPSFTLDAEINYASVCVFVQGNLGEANFRMPITYFGFITSCTLQCPIAFSVIFCLPVCIDNNFLGRKNISRANCSL